VNTGHGHRFRHGAGAEGRVLSECAPDSRWVICANPDRKTVEMGMFRGAEVCVVRNARAEKQMVVGLGSSRYAISKATASAIAVAPAP
jgi:Fe2+ transport system protein FeoA